MVANIIPWFELHTITSVSEFIAHLPERSLEYPWGYRGQGSSDWKLESTLYRERPDLRNVNDLSIKATGFRKIETLLLDKFKAYARPHLTFEPNCDLAWLALGQHFGLPTRLVDWTENPLVALFFALKDATSRDAVVWAFLTPNGLRENEMTLDALDKDVLRGIVTDERFAILTAQNLIKGIYRYHPSHTTNRITAQQGFFTIQSFSQETHFLSLEDQFGLDQDPAMVSGAEEPGGPWFKKYTIPLASKTSIQKELDVLGMNHYAIFPDLEGVAKKLREDVRLEKRF
ncbi:MAG: FRG domain-containing protein [Chloroflexota bacterium]